MSMEQRTFQHRSGVILHLHGKDDVVAVFGTGSVVVMQEGASNEPWVGSNTQPEDPFRAPDESGIDPTAQIYKNEGSLDFFSNNSK